MLLVGKNSVNDVCTADSSSIKYFDVQAENKWRVPLARELIEIKTNHLEVPGFEEEELKRILDFTCTQ